MLFYIYFINTFQWLNLILWAVFAALACLILYGLHGDDNGSVTLSNEVAALYNTVHRTIWGLCISWVIFSCATGNGGKLFKHNLRFSFFKNLCRTICSFDYKAMQYTINDS